MKFNINNFLDFVGNKTKNTLEKTGEYYGKYFIYFVIIYIIYSFYHYFPEYFTYENFTIFTIGYFLIYLFYKKLFFKDFGKSYIKTIITWGYVIKNILNYVMFFGVFIFIIGSQELTKLDTLFIIFFILSIISYFYYGFDLKYEKFKLSNKIFLSLIFILNLLVFGVLYKILPIDLNNKYLLILSILLAYNLFIFYIFTDIFEKIYSKNLEKIKNKKIVITNGLYYTFSIIVIITFIGYSYIEYFSKKETINIIKNEQIEKIKEEVKKQELVLTEIKEEPKKENIEDNKINENNIKEEEKKEEKIDKVEEKPKEEFKKISEIYDFKRYIGIGDKGEDVKKMQEILKQEGYYKGNITGIFDENTSKTFANFMKKKVNYEYKQLGPKAMIIWKNLEIKQ